MNNDKLPVDEENISERPNRVSYIAGLVFVVLMIAAAAVLFSNAEKLQNATDSEEEIRTAFTYENGSGQTFAQVGDGFAVASASGIQLIDSEGKTVLHQLCSINTPAVSAAEGSALFYDIGGSVCKAAGMDGSCTDIDAGECIITADMSTSGYFAVVSEESGSKGLVRVFNDECQPVYEWYSGTAYPVKALVSPDGKSLCVLCIGGSGSTVHFFSLSSEKEKAASEIDGELAFDMYYMSGSMVCVISREGLYFVSADGNIPYSYGFGGKYLTDYDFGSREFAAVSLSEYSLGTSCTVYTVSEKGDELGFCDIGADVTNLSACGKQLLVTTSGSMSLYSQTMQIQDSEEMLITAKRVFLRPGGDALMLSSYSAEIYNF